MARNQKNATIDLQTVLDINARDLADPSGDDAQFKLLINQPESALSLAGATDVTGVILTENDADPNNTLFTINLKELAEKSGNPFGSLQGLQLTVRPNQFERIPRTLSPVIKAGIPLQVWTETRVKEDAEGKFHTAATDRSTMGTNQE